MADCYCCGGNPGNLQVMTIKASKKGYNKHVYLCWLCLEWGTDRTKYTYVRVIK